MWAWIKQIRKEWRMDCIDTLCFYLLWIGLGWVLDDCTIYVFCYFICRGIAEIFFFKKR